MTDERWREILGRLEIQDNPIQPVEPRRLFDFETTHSLVLPESYKSFCRVFGPGELSEAFSIAAPIDQPARKFSLQHINRLAHEGLEYRHYSRDPQQHERGVFFCMDVNRSYHFFDPAEIVDSASGEFAVYTLFSDYELQRTADNFFLFVTESCLGKNYGKLFRGRPKQSFRPIAS